MKNPETEQPAANVEEQARPSNQLSAEMVRECVSFQDFLCLDMDINEIEVAQEEEVEDSLSPEAVEEETPAPTTEAVPVWPAKRLRLSDSFEDVQDRKEGRGTSQAAQKLRTELRESLRIEETPVAAEILQKDECPEQKEKTLPDEKSIGQPKHSFAKDTSTDCNWFETTATNEDAGRDGNTTRDLFNSKEESTSEVPPGGAPSADANEATEIKAKGIETQESSATLAGDNFKRVSSDFEALIAAITETEAITEAANPAADASVEEFQEALDQTDIPIKQPQAEEIEIIPEESLSASKDNSLSDDTEMEDDEMAKIFKFEDNLSLVEADDFEREVVQSEKDSEGTPSGDAAINEEQEGEENVSLPEAQLEEPKEDDGVVGEEESKAMPEEQIGVLGSSINEENPSGRFEREEQIGVLESSTNEENPNESLEVFLDASEFIVPEVPMEKSEKDEVSKNVEAEKKSDDSMLEKQSEGPKNDEVVGGEIETEAMPTEQSVVLKSSINEEKPKQSLERFRDLSELTGVEESVENPEKVEDPSLAETEKPPAKEKDISADAETQVYDKNKDFNEVQTDKEEKKEVLEEQTDPVETKEGLEEPKSSEVLGERKSTEVLDEEKSNELMGEQMSSDEDTKELINIAAGYRTFEETGEEFAVPREPTALVENILPKEDPASPAPMETTGEKEMEGKNPLEVTTLESTKRKEEKITKHSTAMAEGLLEGSVLAEEFKSENIEAMEAFPEQSEDEDIKEDKIAAEAGKETPKGEDDEAMKTDSDQEIPPIPSDPGTSEKRPNSCKASAVAEESQEESLKEDQSDDLSQDIEPAAEEDQRTREAAAPPPLRRVERPSCSNASTPENPAKPLPERLLQVLSNLYLNPSERLRLQYPPRCADDLEYCHKRHFRTPMSRSPSHTQTQSLRVSLQQQRYVSFIKFANDMCLREQFPSEDIFTRLVEMILSINEEADKNNELEDVLESCVELFVLTVRTFPPCWRAYRKVYTCFLRNPIEKEKIAIKDESLPSDSHRVFDTILDLLENTIDNCSAEELRAWQQDAPNDASAEEAKAEVKAGSSEEPLQDLSVFSVVLNQQDWELNEYQLQTFEALPMRKRLERIFIVLQLIAQILEADLATWLNQHIHTIQKWIFCIRNRPLVLTAFDMGYHARHTDMVRLFFKLVGKCVAKGVTSDHLKILERLLGLVMVASNTADIETDSHTGIRFPHLSTTTRKLIRNFFRAFEDENGTRVSRYMRMVEHLRIPFVRFEFIDYFLQMAYTSKFLQETWPKRLVYDFGLRCYKMFPPQSVLDVEGDEDDELSREKYLFLTLTALKEYCAWSGCVTFTSAVITTGNVPPMQTSSDTAACQPLARYSVDTDDGVASGEERALPLERIASELDLYETERLHECVQRPRVDLPLAKICLDGRVMNQYRQDMKYVMIMHGVIPVLMRALPDYDFEAWHEFMATCKPYTCDTH